MVVRMSNNTISYNYLSGLNKALYKQVKAQEQLYKQTRLTRPSDNPVDTVLDMRYKINLTENEQYNKNTDLALSWMNTTHDSLDGLGEIDGLLNQVIQIGNTTIGDRYIFAGQADREAAPFYLEPGNYDVSPPAPPDTVVYTGDDYKISMVVNPGSTNPSLDGVNLTGNEVFNNGKLFEDLIKIRDVLRDPSIVGGTDPVSFLSNEALKMIDEDHDKLLTIQSLLSAKVSMYDLGKDLLGSCNVQIQGNISSVEDVNIADASIAFTVAQNAFNAALSTGAKILPMSLADFLR